MRQSMSKTVLGVTSSLKPHTLLLCWSSSTITADSRALVVCKSKNIKTSKTTNITAFDNCNIGQVFPYFMFWGF